MKRGIIAVVALIFCLLATVFSIRKFTRDGSTLSYSDGVSETTGGMRDSGEPGRATKLPRDEFSSLLGKGDMLVREGNDFLGAEPFYRAALALAKEAARKDPGNGELQHRLAIAHMKLGSLAGKIFEYVDDTAHFNAALVILKSLAAWKPENLRYQKDLHDCHEFFSNHGLTVGPAELVSEHSAAAIDIAARLSLSEPENPNWKYALSDHHFQLGQYSKFTGDLEASERHFSKSLELMRTLTESAAASSGLNIGLDGYLVETLGSNGEVATALGKSTEAKAYFLEALEHSETFGDSAHIRNCLLSLGDFHQKQGGWQEALGYYERMMKLVDEDDRVYLQQRIDDVREKLGG